MRASPLLTLLAAVTCNGVTACVQDPSVATGVLTTAPQQTSVTGAETTGAQTSSKPDMGDSTGHDTGTSSVETSSTSGGEEPASSSSSTTSTVTGEPIGECGNGVQEGVELCDDGNTDEHDGCTTLCRPPACGDGILHAGETCDDGNTDSTDACTEECEPAECGDGFVQAGVEPCDDGNEIDFDECTNACTVANCGDGIVGPGEVCDDSFNDNTYNGCNLDCKSLGPFCGDGKVTKIINSYEYCDGTDPFAGVACSKKCYYDFAQVPQMYCRGVCSWAGAVGCDQADADVFCKLKTGKPLAVATSFKLGTPTDQGGFPCANPDVVIDFNGVDPRIPLGLLPEHGVKTPVFYQTSLIKTTHGGNEGAVIVSVTCD